MLSRIKTSSHKIKAPYLIGIVGATLLGAVASGIAIASVPDSNGTIHACYTLTNTRIIDTDAGQQCRLTEKPLSWSQSGGSSSGTVVSTSQHLTLTGSAADLHEVDVNCPSGKFATGGGFSFTQDDPTQPAGVYIDEVKADAPIVSGSKATGWSVTVIIGGDGTLQVDAICD